MIRTCDVRVDYDDVTAVSDLNLDIPAGEIFGLIGPNGAGKTSTIRVLATLLKPTYGEVFIAGIDIEEKPDDVHQLLGYMPDMPPVYEDLKCWEFLDLFASAYFVSRKDKRKRIDECIELVSLQDKRDKMAGTLSRGMKQRLVLAKTLLHDPQVLLLDEPASGLDPVARIEMRDTLKQLAARGRTILISSHILTELSEFCSSIGIMEKGLMVISGRIDEIITCLKTLMKITVEMVAGGVGGVGGDGSGGGGFDICKWLNEQDNISGIATKNGRVDFDFQGTDAEAAQLLKKMVTENIPVKSFYERHMGVEDILLKVGAKATS